MEKPEPQRAIPFLGVSLITIIGGIVYLSATHAPIPSVLEMLAYGCVVGISGISVPAHARLTPAALVVNQPNATMEAAPTDADTLGTSSQDTTPNA